MAKKTVEKQVLGIENIKNEVVAQITGFVEIPTDQEGIRLTREIDGKKHAVNVHIHQPGEDGKVMVEIQLLAKPIVNEIREIKTRISGKHNDVILLIKKAIRNCRMLHGIKIEIDSIVSDFNRE